MLWCSIASPPACDCLWAMSRILIVEDETIVAESLSQLLVHAGHKVVGIANDERSAIAGASMGRPDLVLMDIRLANGSDGIETAKKIQANRSVMVLFLSAQHDRGTRERAAALQPAGFMPKPFMPVELIAAVAAACSAEISGTSKDARDGSPVEGSLP